jgi:NitT/TauT family transport system substrate-binding protein
VRTSLVKLDYGIPTDKEGVQLRLGVARGFFRDEGIDLNIRIIFGGPEIAAAYDQGSLLVGEIGSPPGITAMAAGARFKAIASGFRKRAVQYFVARREIQEWNDLKGKTSAALSIGSCSYWFMRLVLARRGLDPDRDLNIVGLGQRYPQVLELFQSGELDAAVISEPNVSMGEGRGLFRILEELTDEEFCPTMQWLLVVANDRAIDEQKELLRAVLRASARTYRYCRENPDEWAEFAANWFGTDVSTMRRANDREFPNLGWNCSLDLDGLRQAVDLQKRLNAIRSVPAIEDIVRLEFVPT